MRVWLVEGDTLLGDGIRAGLAQADFAVDWVQDGVLGDTALQTETYAAVVLDLGLSRLSGLDLLRGIRTRGGASWHRSWYARCAVSATSCQNRTMTEGRHRHSIRRRLLLAPLTTTLLVWGATLLLSYRDTGTNWMNSSMRTSSSPPRC